MTTFLEYTDNPFINEAGPVRKDLLIDKKHLQTEQPSKYYQLTGNYAKLCHYLSYPAYYFENIQSKLNIIQKIVIGILIFIPMTLGMGLCYLVRALKAEKIDSAHYKDEFTKWSNKNFLIGTHTSSFPVLIDFFIKNHISADSCPYEGIGSINEEIELGQNYIFEQVDGSLFSVDKHIPQEKILIITPATNRLKKHFYSTGKDIDSTNLRDYYTTANRAGYLVYRRPYLIFNPEFSLAYTQKTCNAIQGLDQKYPITTK